MFFKERIRLKLNTVEIKNRNGILTARAKTENDCTSPIIEFYLFGVEDEEKEAFLSIDYAGFETRYTMPYEGEQTENDFYKFIAEHFADFRIECSATIISNNNYYEENE